MSVEIGKHSSLLGSSSSLRRKFFDALIRPKSDSLVQTVEQPSLISHAGGPRNSSILKVSHVADELTLQSVGPNREDFSERLDNRNVVSEGESFVEDSYCSTFSTTRGDGSETSNERRQRLFVGAGGMLDSETDREFLGPQTDRHGSGDNGPEDQFAENSSDGVESSSSSEDDPIAIKRRKPIAAAAKTGTGVVVKPP